MGVTLRSDLVESVDKAKLAMQLFISSGINDPIAFKQFQQNLSDAQKALDNFGKAEDKLKLKSETTWKGLQQDLHAGIAPLHEITLLGEQAFNDLSKNIQGAFAQIVLGQGNVAKALEQATAQSLATIASQAAVKALFYTAEGFAALASFNGASATQYFTAAGEMAAVAVAAGAAGRALSGAAGAGSSTNEQLHNSVSNTTSQPGGGTNVSGVQHFATGGVISAPTLAIMGEESKKEAVLPLDDPRAIAPIKEAIGGGTHFHVNVQGLISDDNLVKVMGKMSKLVDRNQAHLTSSNSLRITKRSA